MNMFFFVSQGNVYDLDKSLEIDSEDSSIIVVHTAPCQILEIYPEALFILLTCICTSSTFPFLFQSPNWCSGDFSFL